MFIRSALLALIWLATSLIALPAQADMACDADSSRASWYLTLQEAATSCRTSGGAPSNGAYIMLRFEGGALVMDPQSVHDGAVSEPIITCHSGICLNQQVGPPYGQVWGCQGSCLMSFSHAGGLGQNTIRIEHDAAAHTASILASGPDFPDPPAPTTTAISASPAPYAEAQSFVLTARVETDAAIPAQGSIRFEEDGKHLSEVPLSGGVAALSLSALEGTHLYRAVFVPADARHAASQSATTTLIIGPRIKADSAVSVALSATGLMPGDTLAITASIRPEAATGTVDLFIDDEFVSRRQLDASAKASWTVSAPEPGSHSVEIAYTGDLDHKPARSAASGFEVGRLDFAATLNVANRRVPEGQPLQAWVTTPVADVPGVVEFLLDGEPVGDAPIVDGFARLDLTLAARGFKALTARYEGSETIAPWQSQQPIPLELSIIETDVTLAASRDEMRPDQSFDLEVSLDPAPVSGIIEFRRNGVAFDSRTVDSRKVYTAKGLFARDGDAFTAHYSGDASSYPAASTPLVVSVADADWQISLAADAERTRGDRAIGLVATVDPADVDGDVRFLSGDTEIGRAALAGGRAAIEASFAVGTHRVTARFTTPSGQVITSAVVVVTADPTIAALVEERREAIEKELDAGPERIASSRARAMQTVMLGVRERIRTVDHDASRAVSRNGWSGHGAVSATNGSISGSGGFESNVAVSGGSFRFSGEVSGNRSGTSDGLAASLTISREWRPDGGRIAGVFLGLDHDQTDLSGQWSGTSRGTAVSAGAYGARLSRSGLIIDGYALGFMGRHQLQTADDTLSVDLENPSAGILTAVSMGGRIDIGAHFAIEPRASLRQSFILRDRAYGVARSGEDADRMEAAPRYNMISRFVFEPDFIVHGGNRLDFNAVLGPRLFCETSACGYGGELRLNVGAAPAALSLSLGYETMRSVDSVNLALGGELRF